MDCEHAGEWQPDPPGMARSGLQTANLGRCQGMALPVGTVARSASASGAR